MLRRFLFAAGLCFALVFAWGIAGFDSQARAQDDTDRPLASGIPEGYRLYQDEVNAYHQSTSDCSSPSLECLVRNTTRFVAIEWLADIVGPGNSLTTAEGPTSTAPVVASTGGAIGGFYSLMGGMYSYPPANTYRYVADVMDNAGMAPPAYAQGLGFASLDPILSLWKTFRNVAYFFFIAVLIVIGIMIMLRQKVSAQASVSAQQALPSIIISLILVTFSYAIAGLLIDVMYLSMFLIAGLFNVITDGTSTATLGTEMISMNILNLTGMLFMGSAIDNMGSNMNLVTSVVSGLAGNSDSSWWTGFVGFLGGLTLSIVLAVAVLIGTVKLFFELLKSYASIIMGVVFAPLYLMMGAIPGQNAFGPWFKNLIGNLAAFPTVLLFVIIFRIFTENIGNDNAGGFMPPFLFGNGQSGIAGYIIGLAILLALPEIVKEVKKKAGATEGGFGWLVASAAGGRAKEAWNKGFMGVSGKRLASLPYAIPMAAAGGVAGYRYAREKADEAGMKGNAARLAALSGAFGGAVLAPRAPSLAVRGAKTLGQQFAQSQITQFVEDVNDAAKKKKAEKEAREREAELRRQAQAKESNEITTAAQDSLHSGVASDTLAGGEYDD